MFLFEGEEVGIVKVKWDGATERKGKEELQGVMPVLEVVERCAVERASGRIDEVAGFGT